MTTNIHVDADTIKNIIEKDETVYLKLKDEIIARSVKFIWTGFDKDFIKKAILGLDQKSYCSDYTMSNQFKEIVKPILYQLVEENRENIKKIISEEMNDIIKQEVKRLLSISEKLDG